MRCGSWAISIWWSAIRSRRCDAIGWRCDTPRTKNSRPRPARVRGCCERYVSILNRRRVMRLRSRNSVAACTAGMLFASWLCVAAAAAQEDGGAAGSPAAPGGSAAAEPISDPPKSGETDAVAGTAGETLATGGVASDGVASGEGTTAPTATAPMGGVGGAGSLAGPTGAPSSGGFGGGGFPGPAGMTGFGGTAPADNLAGLLGAAMTRNPDIVVAEAKVRAAQSELDRTRLDVSRQVVDAFQAVRFARKSIEIAKAQAANCKEQRARIEELVKTGAVSATEIAAAEVTAREAELALIKAEASLEATMATLDYLTGGQAMPGGGPLGPGMPGMGMPGMGSSVGGTGTIITNGTNSAGSGDASGGLGATGAAGTTTVADAGRAAPSGTQGLAQRGGESGAGGRAIAGGGGDRARAVFWGVKEGGSTFHERLRKKLNEPTTLDFVDASLGDVMRYLDDVHGITNIIIDRQTPDGRNLNDEPISLKLEKVPLAAALKAIEDLAKVHFVVTEYGLRVTVKEVEIEDSTPLRQFLRQGAVTGMLYPGGGANTFRGAPLNPFASGSGGDTSAGGGAPANETATPGAGGGEEGTAEAKEP
ncbi:MAG: hypothetical protein DCC67_13325 [Planctomycetota bacterium]|nr:MAG: hypothetical protein DCC67_13325 [Planctomycetota bacterium]